MLIPAILTLGAVLLGTGVVLDAPVPSWLALGLAVVVAALCLAPPEPDRTAPVDGEPEPADDDVWVIPGRRRFHTADCPVLVGQPADAHRPEAARAEGFSPCSRCACSVAGESAVDGQRRPGDVARSR